MTDISLFLSYFYIILIFRVNGVDYSRYESIRIEYSNYVC
jgi:hypothetical protein